MLYRGQFRTVADRLCTVLIRNSDGSSETVPFGQEPADVVFASDPVELTTDVDDAFGVLIIGQCEINLLVKRYLGDSLFSGGARDILVNVLLDGELVFAGFVEPSVYSQPFSSEWDSLTLNCTDALGTLQYYKYKDIITQEDYDAAKASAGVETFAQTLGEIFRDGIPTLDLSTGLINEFRYDGSVRASEKSEPASVFSDVSANGLAWLGEDLDDAKTEEEVAEGILSYLNLHVVQRGRKFYFFNWASVKSGKDLTFYPFMAPDAYEVEQGSMAKAAPLPTEESAAAPSEMPREALSGADGTLAGNLLELDWTGAPEMADI